MTLVKGFENMTSLKVEDDLMLTVLKGDTDNVTVRELLDIANPDLHTIQSNNKIFLLPIRWVILKGSGSHYFALDDAVTKTDLEELEELNKDDTLKNSSNYVATTLDDAIANKKYGFTYTYDCPFTTLTPIQIKYQLIHEATVTALQDDTRYLCTITNNTNYSASLLDIPTGQTSTLEKQGIIDYVVFSGACEVNGVAIAENTFKRLKSNSINIKNTDSRDIRIVLISK